MAGVRLGVRKGGRELRVRVEGQLVFNGTAQMLNAALAGFGLAYVPEDLAQPHLAKGRLERVLEDGARPFRATTCTTPAAGNPRRRSPCSSMRCAIGGPASAQAAEQTCRRPRRAAPGRSRTAARGARSPRAWAIFRRISTARLDQPVRRSGQGARRRLRAVERPIRRNENSSPPGRPLPHPGGRIVQAASLLLPLRLAATSSIAWRSFSNARASIWRTRSRETP